MHEFNSRISAQRQILQLVNLKDWDKEALFGLSSKAIDRWTAVNRIEPGGQLVTLIRAVSAKLFFLANKSQEQVSERYKLLSSEIADLAKDIASEINKRPTENTSDS
jgi:hypothetical protein